MQLIGFALLGFIVWFGFSDRDANQVISAFDPHAAVMVAFGSLAAVLISSDTTTAARTFSSLRELVPGLRVFSRGTSTLEKEREQISLLWREGKRSAALTISEQSRFPAIKQMIDLILNRAHNATSERVFLELRHAEIGRFQPAINNREMLSKLGPAFGMVGTITGMVQMFRNMSADNLNIGSSMSLALLATLYGVTFGAGVAGPTGHFLNGLLDDRLGALERCEKTVSELVVRGGA